MFNFKDEAKKYIIHISYDKDSNGSGVLIPLKNEMYDYILTSKHTFGKDDDERGDNYLNIKKVNIQVSKISLSNPSNENFRAKEVFFLEDKPELDFLIIQIEKHSYINDLKTLEVFEEDFNHCLPYGYPDISIKGETNYGSFDCTFKQKIPNNKFEIGVKESISLKAGKGTIENFSGLSGAGVFVENYKKNKIYLAGLIVKGTDTAIQILVSLDLEKILKDVNQYLNSKSLEQIKIGGAEWKNRYGFDMNDFDIPKEIEKLAKSNNKFIQEMKEIDSRKIIDNFDGKVKGKLKRKENEFQNISEAYLYMAFNFHQFQAYKRATHYFTKAIEYGGTKNKSYMLEAKSRRRESLNKKEKSEEEKELALTIINSLYKDIEEYEEMLKIQEEDGSTRKLLIESYKKIIEKLEFIGNRHDEILKAQKRLVELYANSKEFDDLKSEVEELKSMIDLNEKFTNMRNQVNDYEEEIKKLNKQIQILPKIDKKLDVITLAIKKTNNKTLDIFLENIVASNRALVSKIQTINHQDNRIHKKAKERLDESINTLNSKLDSLMERPISVSSNEKIEDISQFKQIVEESNRKFYKAIKGLCENETDSYSRKLLEMSLAFTKKEHEVHIEKLEKIHYDEVLEIKRESSLEKNKLEESILELSNWLEKIDSKYSEEKILELERVIQRLEGKNEQIDDKYQELDNEKKRIFSKEFNEILGNIYSSIDALSFEPNDNKESFEKILLDLEKLDTKLESFEDNIEEKVDEVHKKVDIYPIKGDHEINLHFKKSDLEKIEDIMNKNKRPIWNIYCKARFVILGVIFMSGLFILLKSGY